MITESPLEDTTSSIVESIEVLANRFSSSDLMTGRTRERVMRVSSSSSLLRASEREENDEFNYTSCYIVRMKCAWERESDKPIEKKRTVLNELDSSSNFDIILFLFSTAKLTVEKREKDEKEMPDKQLYCLNTFTKQVV